MLRRARVIFFLPKVADGYCGYSFASTRRNKCSKVRQQFRFLSTKFLDIRPTPRTHIPNLKARLLSTQNTHSVSLDRKNKYLEIHLKDGIIFKYPFVWMRDNCQCSRCFEPSAKARLLLLRDVDPDVEAKEASVLDHDRIHVTWSDGHVSVFDTDWLVDRRFTAEAHHLRREFLEKPAECWGNEMQDELYKVSFNDMLSKEEKLFEFLVTLETKGIALAYDTPCDPGQIQKLASKIAYLRNTNYGGMFSVKSKVDPSNLAYTSNALGLHTDLPYYNYTPGMQILHCIKQAGVGGENVFVDGFHAVEQLKSKHPEYYNFLATESAIDYYDVGRENFEFHMLTIVPVIQLNADGKPVKINYNNQVRDSYLNLPLEKVHTFYKALCKYEELLNDDKNRIQIRLKDGDTVFFHNYRVMHGRLAYKLESGSERILEGGYLDWDELRSARRVLENRFGPQV